ncbi:unnamed protein product, partial [Prorocentrum cordatum]
MRHRENCSSCTVRDPSCMRECRLLSSENNEEALGQIQLAVWLAKEKNVAESDWRPWLDLLPSGFGFSPAALREPLLRAAFGGTSVLAEASELQEAWRAAHEVLLRHSPLYARHVGGFETFRTARITVLSRVHGLPGTGDVIVPFVDLLNHDAEAPTWWGPSAKGGFELRASAPLAAGGAVTCSYGSERSSRELLLHYGFAPVSNPWHSVELDLSPDRADPLYAAKRQGLIDLDLYRGFSFSERLGFAKSRPVRAPEGWDQLPVAEQDARMFQEVLVSLRVGALSAEDLEASADHRAALFEQDEGAQERLRARAGALGLSLEGRAARRLLEAVDAQLAPRGGAAGRDAQEVLRGLRAALAGAPPGAEPEPTDSDLQQVAASAAALAATEARLLTSLRSAAEAVARLVEVGAWPEGAGGLAEAGAAAAGAPGAGETARYVLLWARSFAEGRASAGAVRG